MTAPLDVGSAAAHAIAAAVTATLADYGLEDPGILTIAAGASIPVADACDGMVWVRVAGAMPTDGTGTLFAPSRISWDVPAWAYQIEVGHLWCHQNITAEGGWTDAATETEYADRDGAYREAVLEAVYQRWRPQRPDPLAAAVLGQVLQPWAPIGPDGGYSGGIVVTTVIASALAICE